MFNVFAFEKKEREKLEKAINQNKEKELNSKKKILNDNMKINYQKRIKDFIFEMAHNPITVTDYVNPIDCVKNKQHIIDYNNPCVPNINSNIFVLNRKLSSDLYDYTKHKQIIQPGMKFRYLADKERLHEELERYKQIKNELRHKAKSELLKNIDERNQQNNILEKSTVTSMKSNRNSLISMAKFVTMKTDYEDKNDENLSETNKINSDVNITPKHVRSNFRKIKEKKINKVKTINFQSKHKTHFKAAIDFALAGNINLKCSRNYSKKLEYSHSERKVPNNDYVFGRTFRRSEEKLISNPDAFKDLNSELSFKNPLLFNNKSSIFNNPNYIDEDYDNELLAKLRTLTISQNLKEDITKNKVKKVNFIKILKNPKNKNGLDKGVNEGVFKGILNNIDHSKNFEYKKPEDEKIVIDNKEFFKSEIDKIARKILTKCNFNHNKNPNNIKSLKTGEGKLMITNGLTLNQFYDRYQL